MQSLTLVLGLVLPLLPASVVAGVVNVAYAPAGSDVLRDGNTTTCKNKSVIYFSLSQTYTFRQIRLYTTSPNASFHYCPDAQRVYTPDYLDLICRGDHTGNYIYINELNGSTCEVQVIVCPKSLYGPDCTIQCPPICSPAASGRMCDVITGNCTQPCPAGWQGGKCDQECLPGRYGQDCRYPCGNCIESTCNNENGQCNGVCKAGWKGPHCDKHCDPGTYGEGNSSRCPNQCSNCEGDSCRATDGVCTGACKPGWQPTLCQQECDPGRYGQDCLTPCGNCRDSTCNHVDGRCNGVCKAGWKGSHCNEHCANGTYGEGNSFRCPNKCSNCKGGSCRATDGDCTGGCKPGWQPTLCQQACDPGRYGRDCLTPCGNCNDSTCDHVDGQCNGVCKAGWKGWRCDEQCDKGTFGQGGREGCPQSCGHCKDGECSPVDGRCPKGCEPGWQSFLCSTPCDRGRYGEDCLSPCGNCRDSTCDHVDGRCNGVCKAGWKGSHCNEPCDDKTFGDCSKQCACRNSSEVCNKSTGMCQSGCRDGKTGGDCQQDCPDRYFGNCETPCRCKDPNERCDKVTGKCDTGCPDGKRGHNCYECQAGRYGIDCEHKCHCRDTDEACNPASGACNSGCPIGWRGSDCQDKCEDGVFGDNCGTPCWKSCTNSSCHHVTGYCALGCVEGWEGDDCSKESSSVPVAAVAGSLAALIIIIIAVFGFCYWRRKKGKLADPGCEEIATSRRFSGLAGVSNHNHDNVVEENEGAVVVSKPETMEAMYSNAAPLARPSHVIAVLDLPKGLAKWRSEGRFNTEFQNLPQGLTEPHSAAYSAENKSKNRYANICAYDHSRVKLSVPPGSGQTDYINACFVDGYKSPRQFIASQGPNDVILYDFVRMLLEHDVSTVVMLTNLYEDGKPKCNQYWPEHTEATFGGITVTMTSMVTRRDYVIRDLTLSTKGGQRSVSLRHCHFLSWPDKGVPASPWPLLDFRDVAIENAPAGRPVVVHCSAGIGRTGTFIAMDVLLRQAQAEGSIDVLQCVTALRQARTQMVQTVEQYGFLHEAVLMGLCAAGSALPNDVFLQRYSNFMSPPGSNKSPVGKEFQKLMQCPFDISDEEVAMGKQPENKDKNVDPKILPVAGTRVQLMTSIPDSNGYINAIFLSDYEGRDKFILTQTPAANTVREFWAVVADFNVTAIVTLDSSPDKAYWPEKEEDFGPTKVQVLPPTDMEHFLVSSATVSKDGSSISVKRFQLKKMPDSLKAKSDPKPLVTLREEVDKVKADGRVLVHSRNGAGLGGLYCVLSVLVRRAVEDRVVALPYSLSLVKRLRPQIVQSQNEYEFLYVAAKYHLDHHQPSPSDVSAEGGDEENIYANEEPEALYGNA